MQLLCNQLCIHKHSTGKLDARLRGSDSDVSLAYQGLTNGEDMAPVTEHGSQSCSPGSIDILLAAIHTVEKLACSANPA